MNPRTRFTLVRLLRGCAAASVLCLLLGFSGPLVRDGNKPAETVAPKKSASGSQEPLPVEAQFHDGSNMKLSLREEHLEFVTPYGKLLIPAADIRHIDFGFHVDEATAKRVESAIANLGKTDFKEREAATAELLELGAKAYPALLQATKSKDAEVVRRAEAVLNKLRETLSPEQLTRPTHDVLQTVDSKFTGHISAEVFKVKTLPFGDQVVKLGDLRTLHSHGVVDPDLAAAQPDPGNLYAIQDKIGKTFVFKVTGAATGNIWGTGIYTTDSTLAVAAVHAGVLKPGQAGLVKVLIVNPPPAFDGSTQNGVTSSPYGPYPNAYQIVR